MPAPKRVAKMAFILVPTPEGMKLELAVHAAKRACRVAHQMQFVPMCPLLYFLTYLSPGELHMEQRRLFHQWLRRADRIWLQFPEEEHETLDALSFQILERNRQSSARLPVYQLHPAGEEFLPVVMDKSDVRELLAINLTTGLVRHCV